MTGNLWQAPPGAGGNQLYLWAMRLSQLMQIGKHKDYVIRSVTLSSGTTTTVTDDGVTASCRIFLQPTNSGAAALSPYVSARTAGTSFVLAHGSAGGTETYDCLIIR